MFYDADIFQTDRRDGTFEARLRGSALSVPGRDPEHDLCDAMLRAGFLDGEIQFWRGTIPTLRIRSVHQAAQYVSPSFCRTRAVWLS